MKNEGGGSAQQHSVGNNAVKVDSDARNWLNLANHFQEKVSKRSSEVSFLHTKAGFLIAGACIELQILSGFPHTGGILMFGGFLLAAITAVISLAIAIISMNIAKSPTALKPDEMILVLTESPGMSERAFANWLAKSYAEAYKQFNLIYDKKYTQQIYSAIFLAVSFILTTLLKGFSFYV